MDTKGIIRNNTLNKCEYNRSFKCNPLNDHRLFHNFYVTKYFTRISQQKYDYKKSRGWKAYWPFVHQLCSLQGIPLWTLSLMNNCFHLTNLE